MQPTGHAARRRERGLRRSRTGSGFSRRDLDRLEASARSPLVAARSPGCRQIPVLARRESRPAGSPVSSPAAGSHPWRPSRRCRPPSRAELKAMCCPSGEKAGAKSPSRGVRGEIDGIAPTRRAAARDRRPGRRRRSCRQVQIVGSPSTPGSWVSLSTVRRGAAGPRSSRGTPTERREGEEQGRSSDRPGEPFADLAR